MSDPVIRSTAFRSVFLRFVGALSSGFLPTILISVAVLSSACGSGGSGGGSEEAAVQNDAPAADIVVGTSLRVPSSVYGQDQSISVHLPEGYEDDSIRYPVIFATHSTFLHLAGAVANLASTATPPAILVYLDSYDTGDFLPTPISSRPGSGGADRLVRFFAQDLIPFIEGRYRTHPFRIFHSGSWGGVFCLHAILSRPDVFQGCIAATPWVIYDEAQQHLVRTSGALLRRGAFETNFLYIALGNDPDEGLREGVEALADTIRAVGPEGLTFEYRYLPGEDHYSIGHKAFFDGLRWIFRDWVEIPESTLAAGWDAVERYLAALEARFGYDIGVRWNAAYRRGSDLLLEGELTGARRMFELCVDLAPAAPDCLTGLGRVHEAGGNLEDARQAYERALELAEAGGEPDLARYRDAVERIGGTSAPGSGG